MTEKGRRFLFGIPLLVMIGVFAYLDLDRPRPIFGPVLLALLGLGALTEYLRLVRALVPRLLRQVAWLAGLAVLLWPLLIANESPREMGNAILAATLIGSAALIVAMLALRFRAEVEPGDLAAISIATMGIAVTALPLALLTAIFFRSGGVSWVLLVVLTSKFNDIGGYLMGSKFGKHRLCPGISPKKSVEGAVFGLLFGTGAACLLRAFCPTIEAGLGWLELFGFAAAIGVSTQAGDLFESLIKRTVKVKDSGALIPAFGGLLDLVDSLILAGPVGYTLLVACA